MPEINKVNVVIDGEVFELSSPESPEYIQKVATYIDNKITEIHSKKAQGALNSRLKTLFISLNIADDLFEEKRENAVLIEKVEDMEAGLDNYKYEISQLNDENDALKKKVKELESLVTEAENQLNEYIEVFEISEGIKNNKVKRLQ